MDEGHGRIHLWISPKKGPHGKGGDGPPVSVDVPFSEAGATALERAERGAGAGGQVMIGPQIPRKGNNHSNGQSPFNNIPFVIRPATWPASPPKLLP